MLRILSLLFFFLLTFWFQPFLLTSRYPYIHQITAGCDLHPSIVAFFTNFIAVMRSEYEVRGFQEVITPLVFNKKLWQTVLKPTSASKVSLLTPALQSGHWQHYSSDMFFVAPGQHFLPQADGQKPAQPAPATATKEEIEDDEHMAGLKPMNCPSHCLIFASERRSYKDLPLRYSKPISCPIQLLTPVPGLQISHPYIETKPKVP